MKTVDPLNLNQSTEQQPDEEGIQEVNAESNFQKEEKQRVGLYNLQCQIEVT